MHAPSLERTPATRLYFIVARNAPRAVVFRRGPTRQVELLLWNLRTDRLTVGQWLKGRIYERRADLSPSGDLLIYFAAKYETGMRTWTAISRPPFLTALALWPKGDAWGGGGLFDQERRIRLNHRADEMKLEPGLQLPPSVQMLPLGAGSGWGEDDPIHDIRLRRDGWRLVQAPVATTSHELGDEYFVTYEPPLRYTRTIGPASRSLTLEMSIEAIHERNGAWYVLSYRVLDGDAVVRDLGRLDWAERGPNGDLLFAREGQLFRVRRLKLARDPSAAPVVVADLRDHRFEARKAPARATKWPGTPRTALPPSRVAADR